MRYKVNVEFIVESTEYDSKQNIHNLVNVPTEEVKENVAEHFKYNDNDDCLKWVRSKVTNIEPIKRPTDKTCKRCNGKKEIKLPSQYPRMRTLWVTCSDCLGTGKHHEY